MRRLAVVHEHTSKSRYLTGKTSEAILSAIKSNKACHIQEYDGHVTYDPAKNHGVLIDGKDFYHFVPGQIIDFLV